MPSKGKNKNELVFILKEIFSLKEQIMWKKCMWLRAKTKTKLKPELQMKVVWSTSNREHGGNEAFQSLSMKTARKCYN